MPTLDNNPSNPPGYPPPFGVLSASIPNPTWPVQNDGDPISPFSQTAMLYNNIYLNHTLYQIGTQYFFSSGLGVLPIAGPVGTNNMAVRFCAPQMGKYVTWEGLSEDNTQVAIPNPQPSGYEILLNGGWTFNCPVLDASGQVRSWHAKGWYLYGQTAVRTVNDGYYAGAPVTDQISFASTLYNASNFVTGVLGPSSTPGGAVLPPYPQNGAEGLGL